MISKALLSSLTHCAVMDYFSYTVLQNTTISADPEEQLYEHSFINLKPETEYIIFLVSQRLNKQSLPIILYNATGMFQVSV